MNASVHNRFAALLGERRLKISEVARATGISRTTLTNLYYSKSGAISFEVLAKLCAYLGCQTGELLEVQGEVRA